MNFTAPAPVGTPEDAARFLDAVRRNDLTAAGELLAAGAVDVCGAERSATHQPLTVAIELGYTDMAELLLRNGAIAGNRIVPYAKQPLLHAVTRGNAAIVRLLLEHGANVVGKNVFFVYPQLIARAFEGGSQQVLALLLRAQPLRATDKEVLFHSLTFNAHQVELVHALVDSVINSSTLTAQERAQFLGSNMFTACHRGNEPVVRKFIAAGITPRSEHLEGISLFSCLHGAVTKGHIEVARVLLANGWDVNAFSEEEGQPLGMTLMNGQVPCAELLLYHGARWWDPQGISLVKAAGIGKCTTFLETFRFTIDKYARVQSDFRQELRALYSLYLCAPAAFPLPAELVNAVAENLMTSWLHVDSPGQFNWPRVRADSEKAPPPAPAPAPRVVSLFKPL